MLTRNIGLVERVIAFTCRRHRFEASDADDFASIVKLKLVENDYAILRKYEARSGLSTFLNVVVQRMALDYRVQHWGRWRPSAEAKRLGPLAIDLEQLLRRDGRSLDEALTTLAGKHEDVTRQALQSLAARIPERAPRPREVDLTAAESVAGAGCEEADDALMRAERRRTSERVSALMSAFIVAMPETERMILELHFGGGMTVSQIARMLQLDQKQLYRRIEAHIRAMRAHLVSGGVAPDDALDLIGRDEAPVAFTLRNLPQRPSMQDKTVAAGSEGSP